MGGKRDAARYESGQRVEAIDAEEGRRVLEQRFPWSATQLSVNRPLEYCWEFTLKGTVDDYWPHISDTSRLYRYLRMPEVFYKESGGQLNGRSKWFGVPLVWKEPNWEWIEGQTLICRRDYSRGPASFFKGILQLDQLEDGQVKALAYFGWIPRNAAGRLMLKFVFPKMKTAFAFGLHRIQQAVGPPEKLTPFPTRKIELSAEAEQRLSSICDGLLARGTSGIAVRQLRQLIKTADEMELHRLQVRRLARVWQLDYRELLDVCLHATNDGMLSLHWDVLCPHCRGVQQSAQTLSAIPRTGHCAVCELEFDTESKHSIEVTFSVHPAIRLVRRRHYCAAEPATKPHIKLQQRVKAGQTITVSPLLTPGGYRLRIPGVSQMTLLDVRSDSENKSQRVLCGRLPEQLDCTLHPSMVIENDTEREILVVIEEMKWSDHRLLPADLFQMQSYHNLFGEQALDLGVHLDLGRQAILFIDIVGSTRLFEQLGDVAAFSELNQAFETIAEVVGEHRGALIKTMGDGAMLAFSAEEDAARAAIALQQRFETDGRMQLRVSGHCGPCLAVSFNRVLDYFGRTVIIANRLQQLCGAGEIVISDEFLSSPGVEVVVGGFRSADPDHLPLPELSTTVTAHRHRCLPEREPGRLNGESLKLH